MAVIDARPLIDKEGNQFFPFTDVSCVNGLPDNIGELNSNDVIEDLSSIKIQIANLQSAIENTVHDTDWQNIILNEGIIPYSLNETPKARLISVSGVSFLSLKGAVKGLTTTGTIGHLPESLNVVLSENRPFVQNSSVISNTPNFARWRVQTTGNLDLERATQSTISASNWFPINTTIMI
ncbi:hypothetical protein [Staphylococcus xylosus]|uniref:hypothetical protein n=1 Tax=Staphylococcus xylosus TaxID=1288 RepID=UPI0015C581D1|nr:hypothetical protein [Staphylococcus xylosus]NQD98946.1 hypothetical protein [Staphylococcus xylosus]